jgi:hypothetical protein
MLRVRVNNRFSLPFVIRDTSNFAAVILSSFCPYPQFIHFSNFASWRWLHYKTAGINLAPNHCQLKS